MFKGVLSTLAVTAMLFVSCTEPYDDTAIRQEIADLYEKVNNLEKKLNDEVSALKTLIDSKTVVASATKKDDGSWEILLTNGEKVTVYPQYQPEAEKNNGCVTVVKEGDTYYWAQIVDGAAVAITDAAGNKIAVSHPQAPAPEFRVNPTTGDVELTVDGGNTWVVVEKKAEPTCLFTGVVDGETSVDFTLASGEVISVPKAETIDFGVQAGKTFVAPGESVEVALKAENIDDLTVIAKPEGWKATISGKTLTVVAPLQEKIDAGEAELEGLVKIHAAGGDGKCMVGKLAVSASTASVLLEVVGDELTIYNNVVRWEEPAAVFYGMMPQSEFSAAGVAAAMNDYTLNMQYAYAAEVKLSLKELYNQMLGNWDEAAYVEIPSGQTYVIWALSEGEGWSYVYTESDVLFTTYTPPFLNVEATVAFNDIQLTATAGGHAGYIVGALQTSTFEMAKEQLQSSFIDWQDDWGTFGEEIATLNFSGSIVEFPGTGFYSGIQPDSNYLLYILPLVDGKAKTEYVFDDIKLYEYTTTGLEAGGSETLTFEATEITYNSVEVLVTGSENTSMVYAATLTEEELAQYKTDEELLDFVWSYCKEYGAAVVGNQSYAMLYGYNPGQTGYVVGVAVDQNGKYGQLCKQAFTTKAVSYNESLTVVIDTAASKIEVTTASIKVSTEGGTAVSYRYMAVEKGGYYWTDEATAEAALATDDGWYVKTIEASALVDGVINLSDLETNSEHAFAIVAVDEAGNTSHASFYYFTPTLPEYPLIRATDESYATMKPTVNTVVSWDDYYGRFNVDVTVTPAAGTTKYWVAVLGEDYLSSETVARDAVDYMILKEGQYYGTTSYTTAGTHNGATYDVNSNVWITWVDEAGNYYECICEPVFTQTLVEKGADAWTASQPTITTEVVTGDDGLMTLNYTVTPGTGATNMYIYAFPSTNYRTSVTNTYMLTVSPEAIQSATAYTGTLGSVQEDALVIVAWTDAEGNLYEIKKSTDK